MSILLRAYCNRKLPVLIAGAGVVCALLTAPLIRSLPEARSITVYFVLMPLQIAFGLAGMLLGPDLWQRTRDRRGIAAFVLGSAVFVIIAINYSTPWLWPYSRP